MILAVSGTPGSGKTTLAKLLAKELSIKYRNITSLVRKKAIKAQWDRKDKVWDVRVSAINAYIKSQKNIILDGHMTHEANVDIILVCTCKLPLLHTRLVKRGYSVGKTRENMDAEIFKLCLNEAYETGKPVLEVDCSKNLSKKRISEVTKFIRHHLPQLQSFSSP